MLLLRSSYSFFFFNITAPSVIYTLSLHDALPISSAAGRRGGAERLGDRPRGRRRRRLGPVGAGHEPGPRRLTPVRTVGRRPVGRGSVGLLDGQRGRGEASAAACSRRRSSPRRARMSWPEGWL